LIFIITKVLNIPNLSFIFFRPLRIELDFRKIRGTRESNIKIEVWVERGFNIIVAVFDERFNWGGVDWLELPVFGLNCWISRSINFNWSSISNMMTTYG